MIPAANPSSCHWANRALAAPFLTMVQWYRVAEERAALRELPSERLTDLGLSKRDVDVEVRRPFWQATR